MKIALLLANGFEEVEALAPLDLLRRAGAHVDTIGIGGTLIEGTHGIKVVSDIEDKNADASAYGMVILPGGMPGAKNLDESDFAGEIISRTAASGGRLAAICAAPMVLGHRGLLSGKRAICYPGFEGELRGAVLSDQDVVTDGNITTARGMSVALAFGEELVSLIKKDESEASDSGTDTFDEECIRENELEEDESCAQRLYSMEPAEDNENAAPAWHSDYSKYKLPPTALLCYGKQEDGSKANGEIKLGAEQIIKTLEAFGISATLSNIERGPRITRYSIVPNKGVRVNQIEKLADDIALALAAESVRIEAPIPGKSAIGIEIPNRVSSLVSLRELLESDEFMSKESKTAVCLGRSVDGTPVFDDIATMPHALIAGATGMGKSVLMNSLITSMLYKASPAEVRFIMIDPKQVEFTIYNGLPHLLVPVITDARMAAGALIWALDEMNRRYDAIEKLSVRNINSYNEKVKDHPELGAPLPRIIIFIDELNDLMLQAKDPIENLIMCIAQKARAAGIHLIIGTQRPSVNVITGVIKANIPTRIACKVASGIDSRTILEQTGAEKLIGKGDMLVALSGNSAPKRVQSAFVSESEIEATVNFIKAQVSGDIYDGQAIADMKRAAEECGNRKAEDEEYEESPTAFANDQKFISAVELAIRSGSVATSFLQRKLKIGYGKAAQYIDIMEDLGIVGEKNGSKPREILISIQEWHKILAKLINT